jgi:hypothetical protein|uniref:SHSP domain-containing protein n=1 Tax=Haptolina ericina TaxID=156174 RepID=A0A7S3EX14_9EUKA
MVLEEGQLFQKLEGARDPTLPPVQKSPSHLEGLPTPHARTAPPGPKEGPPPFRNVSLDFLFDEQGRHQIHVGLPGVKTASLTVGITDGRLHITGKHKDEHGRQCPVAVNAKLPHSADLDATPLVEKMEHMVVVTLPRLAGPG